MMHDAVLGIDIGTSGTKALLLGLDGREITTASRAYPFLTPQPGWVEQDPEELWGRVAATTRQVLQESGIDPAEVAGVGVSAQMWNTLPVDERGRPLTPMLSWLDLRSVRQADRVLSGDTPAFIFKHTGNIPTAKDSIPKIVHFRRSCRPLRQRAAPDSGCPVWRRHPGNACCDHHPSTPRRLPVHRPANRHPGSIN